MALIKLLLFTDYMAALRACITIRNALRFDDPTMEYDNPIPNTDNTQWAVRAMTYVSDDILDTIDDINATVTDFPDNW